METEPVPYPVAPADFERTLNDFSYHAPFGDQAERYGRMRDTIGNAALHVLSHAPASRERSLALTKLDEASFWAAAAIARNERNPDA